MAHRIRPEVRDRELVYSDPYQQIYRVTADFGSYTKEYFVRESGMRVGALVVVDGNVLLVRQYRLLLDDLAWEIPGGKQESGETLQASVVRECIEETGLECLDPGPLAFFHPGLDVLNNPTHIFLSLGVRVVPRNAGLIPEVVSAEWVPLERCLEMVSTHQIADSLSVVALLTWAGLRR